MELLLNLIKFCFFSYTTSYFVNFNTISYIKYASAGFVISTAQLLYYNNQLVYYQPVYWSAILSAIGILFKYFLLAYKEK